MIRAEWQFGKFYASVDRLIGRQVPYAVARTLTQLAQGAKAATEAEMRARFDRPTPWTMRSLFYVPADKRAHPIASRVWLKDDRGRKSPRSVIGHQFLGGDRNVKGIEYLLRRIGLLGGSEYVAPGAGARLDAYGNLSRGQVVQITSQLRLGADAAAWSSKSARSKRAVARAGAMFFSRGPGQWQGAGSWLHGRAQHLPRGVYMRTAGGVRPILAVIRKPHYRQRINLQKIGRDYHARNFDRFYRTNYAEAMRTAR
jgi:hypothetical protein